MVLAAFDQFVPHQSNATASRTLDFLHPLLVPPSHGGTQDVTGVTWLSCGTGSEPITGDVKRVCSWCAIVLERGSSASAQVTHSICRDCMRAMQQDIETVERARAFGYYACPDCPGHGRPYEVVRQRRGQLKVRCIACGLAWVGDPPRVLGGAVA